MVIMLIKKVAQSCRAEFARINQKTLHFSQFLRFYGRHLDYMQMIP